MTPPWGTGIGAEAGGIVETCGVRLTFVVCVTPTLGVATAPAREVVVLALIVVCGKGAADVVDADDVAANPAAALTVGKVKEAPVLEGVVVPDV